MFCAAMSASMVTRLLHPFNGQWAQVGPVLDPTALFETTGDGRGWPLSTQKWCSSLPCSAILISVKLCSEPIIVFQRKGMFKILATN